MLSQIKEIVLEKLSSKHPDKWEKYEKVLMARTILQAIVRIIISLSFVVQN